MLQGDSSAEPINILAVDAMIADIDARTSRQMDAIIHAPEFQELESPSNNLIDSDAIFISIFEYSFKSSVPNDAA